MPWKSGESTYRPCHDPERMRCWPYTLRAGPSDAAERDGVVRGVAGRQARGFSQAIDDLVDGSETDSFELLVAALEGFLSEESGRDARAAAFNAGLTLEWLGLDDLAVEEFSKALAAGPPWSTEAEARISIVDQKNAGWMESSWDLHAQDARRCLDSSSDGDSGTPAAAFCAAVDASRRSGDALPEEVLQYLFTEPPGDAHAVDLSNPALLVSAPLQAWVWFAAATVRVRRHHADDYRQAVELLDDAARIATQPLLQTRILRLRGLIQGLLGDRASSVASLETARAVAAASGLEYESFRAAVGIAESGVLQGDVATYHDAFLEIARRGGRVADPVARFIAFEILGRGAEHLGCQRVAARVQKMALDAALESENAVAIAGALRRAAELEPDFERAESLITRAEQAMQQHSEPNGVPEAQLALAQAMLLRRCCVPQRGTEVRALAAQALEVFTARGQELEAADALRVGGVAMSTDDPDTGLQWLRSAVATVLVREVAGALEAGGAGLIDRRVGLLDDLVEAELARDSRRAALDSRLLQFLPSGGEAPAACRGAVAVLESSDAERCIREAAAPVRERVGEYLTAHPGARVMVLTGDGNAKGSLWILGPTMDDRVLLAVTPPRVEEGAEAESRWDPGVADRADVSSDLLQVAAPHLREATRILILTSGAFDLVPFDARLADVGVTGVAVERGRVGTRAIGPWGRVLEEGVGTVVATSGTQGEALPGTLAEAAVLTELFPRSRTLLGPDAAIQQVVESLDTSSWAHFAAHAENTVNRAWQSRLVLADGHLKADRIRRLDLSELDLVTLAACSTRGGWLSPSAGSLSLASAFHEAGATWVISTLEDVEDQAAALLMRYFYESAASGRDPGISLMEAKARHPLSDEVDAFQVSRLI